MLPLYLSFLGLHPTRAVAYAGVAFTVLVAFLLVSRLPVYSGKSAKIPGDRVLPVILAVVLYFLLLVSYPWYTLTASVAAYLVFLPFSVIAYSKRARKEGEALLPPDVDEGTAGRD
jgi:CDP-diacylglycerol--serine O-phosphatidyltransferase